MPQETAELLLIWPDSLRCCSVSAVIWSGGVSNHSPSKVPRTAQRIELKGWAAEMGQRMGMTRATFEKGLAPTTAKGTPQLFMKRF